MYRNRFTPLGLLQHLKNKGAVDEEDDAIFYKSIDRSQKRRKCVQNESEKKRRRSSTSIASSSPLKKEKVSGYMYVLDNGKLRLGTPYDSLWWINYVLLPPEELNSRQRMKFRRRYRMPYETWKDFVKFLNESPILQPWHKGSVDCIGKAASPIELLSLGALKYLGRKCTFDCLEELTFISERTHERFFKKFIEFGESTLYPKYVISPTNHMELQMQLDMMKSAGFPGCCASSDATHVLLENVRFGLRQIHKGWKLNKTARSYNICVTHTRRILSSTSGHPSRWNDQSIAWFDDFLVSMRNGEILQEYEFELYEYGSNGNVIVKKYIGVWCMVDNGYHNWPTTIPPYTFCTTTVAIRWSQWLESLRKDVECTIGILKKRWSLLSKGVQAKNIVDADRVWKTCCALHNMLLEIDGLDELWQPENMSIVDDSTEQSYFSLQRLLDPNTEDNNETVAISTAPIEISPDTLVVSDLDFETFREKLAIHFDILFKQSKIAWPVGVKVPRSV